MTTFKIKFKKNDVIAEIIIKAEHMRHALSKLEKMGISVDVLSGNELIEWDTVK